MSYACFFNMFGMLDQKKSTINFLQHENSRASRSAPHSLLFRLSAMRTDNSFGPPEKAFQKFIFSTSSSASCGSRLVSDSFTQRKTRISDLPKGEKRLCNSYFSMFFGRHTRTKYQTWTRREKSFCDSQC